MPTMPKLAPKLAEDKPDRTTGTPPSDQADAQEFAQESATITKPSLEPIHDHLKNSTLITSEEDASEGIHTEQPTKTAASENLDSTSKATKDLADCGMVEGSGDTGSSTAGSTDARMDPKPTEKVKRAKSNKISGSEEFGDDDSQDDDDIDAAILEEDDLAYTAEGQKLYKQRATKRIKLFGQYFWNVEYRMGFLESELKKLKGDNLETQPKDNAEKATATTSKVIRSIRRLNWADYKGYSQDASELSTSDLSQRFTAERIKGRQNLQEKDESHFAKASGDQNDATPGATGKHQHHVLEVLIEDPGVQKRRRVKKYTEEGNITKTSGRNTKTHQESDVIPGQTSKTTLQCPERLRICSEPLIDILERIVYQEGDEPWDTPYLVFLRPFKFLVLYQKEIRDILKDLEKNTKPEERQGEANNGIEVEDTKEDIAILDPAVNTAGKMLDSEALEPLRLLVEFLDNDLKSTFALRGQIDAKEARSIVFADLWHLYKHGQEVRAPDDKLQVFKVAKFTGGRDLLSKSMPPDYLQVPSSCLDREESNGAFFIECYRYDFDGTQYGPVHEVFEIRRYEGLRNIRSLQVYPLCYDPEHQKERNRLVQRGEKFMTLARVNKTAHKTYRGLSLDEHAEEIESPIIVDFQLAIAKGKIRTPWIGFQSELDHDPREVWETPHMCGFKGCEIWEAISRDYYLDVRASERFLANQKPHMIPVEDPEELGEDEQVLLPPYVHGFVLRSRKWRTFNIDEVEDIKYSSAFDDLVLPPGHKTTVEALVNRHSRGTETFGSRTEVKSSMDLVTGKGKGLIILLHGAPGVGKTSTAECVADKTERPLFPITCGDLGESAIEVEESLERNFSLAHKWGCVLLLDEADVFLTVRNQTDLRRNAVVSVFLRTLEYYSGILFLTTNRVGALDPAFKSRIHISLYYPKLGRKASSEIWRNHIQKAREYFEQKGGKYTLRKSEIIEFSKQHFKDLRGEEPWNGRQIRNAFQTAIALAEYEAYLKDGKPELSERHFRKVATASSDFDRYLRMTHGRSESQLAEASKIRTDDPEKAAKKMAAFAQRQHPRGQPKSEDGSSETDSSEQDSSDADDTSSSEEPPPPPRATKKSKKKQKAPSEDETPPTKKGKNGRTKRDSVSEEEAPFRRKSKKEKVKQESSSEEEALPTKKTKGKGKQEPSSEEEAAPTKKSKKEKESRKKRKEASGDDQRDSTEEEKEVKKPAKETKAKEKEKEKSKTTSKSFN